MARKPSRPKPRAPRASNTDAVGDYRYREARRKNNPPAGIAPTYEVRERKVTRYEYDPHLDPQLVWSGKKEHTSFEVDVVSLHIHERISTRAILEAVKKPEPQLALFGETPLPADQQIEFYQHEVGWANRLILGDSVLVMNSLLVKEGMAGKVQMIYVDPPYGIKYASNFQARVDRHDVKDKDEDLTHEPEQIRAYRDTWKLGVHSYLTYMRDRLLLSRELLSETGSIFVQMGEENLHLVRCLLDEVFGREHFVAIIAFRKKQMPLGAEHLDSICDYLIWYAKRKEGLKYRQLFVPKSAEGDPAWGWVLLRDGSVRRLTADEIANHSLLPQGSRVFQAKSLKPAGFNQSCVFHVHFRGVDYPPPGSWVTNESGMKRLIEADRVVPAGEGLRYVLPLDDYPVTALSNMWVDTGGVAEKMYAVQTSDKVVERCILMTTDPGDLVLDPTCGSGTTAYCAEKWGRRWITCDTSRVALAIARQRLMTARYEYYELADPERGVAAGFIYETVPHITLESIAKNPEIDAIGTQYQPQIEAALADLNKRLKKRWNEWEVPRQADPGWSNEERQAHARFWNLMGQKRQEIDASIQRNAPQEVLYDRPKLRRGIIRVSGPFTVEAIPLPAVEDPSQMPIPEFEQDEARARVGDRGGDYVTTMANLLRQQGVILFPGGKRMDLTNVRPLNISMLHAEAEIKQNGRTSRLAVSFGPQYGPVTALQVQEAIPTAKMNGYMMLIFAGFSFEPEAQALIQKATVQGLQVHFANVAPDVLLGDLLKTNRASQIFTAFGQPDVQLEKQKDGTYVVELLGVDIYDPLTGSTRHTAGRDVAAWFLDSDYDGMTFRMCQAFFPGDSDAWSKLQRALRAQIDPALFQQMRGTKSFPFKSGEHHRLAVKVLDFRGNEVIRVMPLERQGGAHGSKKP